MDSLVSKIDVVVQKLIESGKLFQRLHCPYEVFTCRDTKSVDSDDANVVVVLRYTHQAWAEAETHSLVQ